MERKNDCSNLELEDIVLQDAQLKIVIENIQKICEIICISQRQLAKMANLDTKTVNHIINARHNPRLSTLSAIANAFGVTLEQLCSKNAFELFTEVKPKDIVLQDETSNTVAKNIRNLCIRKGIFQYELAELANITVSTLSNTINAKYNINPITLIAIANAFGVTIEDLYSPNAFEVDLKIVLQNIIELCKCRELSQSKLAEMANLDLSTVHKMINAKQKPRISTLIAMTNALEVTIEDLCYPNAVQKILGRNIEYLCIFRGISQNKLAKMSNVQAVYDIINARHNPKLSTLSAIAGAFGVTIKELYSSNAFDVDFKIIGENIKNLCIRRGIFQYELAEMAHMEPKTVSNVINARHNPEPSILHAIADAFGVTLKDLCVPNAFDVDFKIVLQNIKTIYEYTGITYNEIATKAYVSLQTVYQTISKGKISIATLPFITQAFGFTIEDLCSPITKEQLCFAKLLTGLTQKDVDPKIVAENIENICKHRGISYSKLAKKANLHLTTVLKIINSRCNPRLSTLTAIADVLGITLEQLGSKNAFELFIEEAPKDIDQKIVAENIKKACIDRDIFYVDLAKQAGISYSSFDCLINARHPVSNRTIYCIANALGISVKKLCSVDDELAAS